MHLDLTPLIHQLYKQFIYIILFMTLIALLKSRFLKGFFGELLVNLFTSFSLNKKTYHLIKNVTLPTKDGTTQIDHVIVSKYGIFIVETKNLKGWIFGSEKQRMWTQKIYRHSNTFQNPLHQNYKHLNALESLLNIDADKMFSLVVFIGDSKFKTPMPKNVTHGYGYVRFIKSKTEQVLDDIQVNEIIEKIKQTRLQPGLKTHLEHLKHVTAAVENKEIKNICPLCGSKMVIRVARKGENKGKSFWGCSNFPRCRHTKEAA